MARNKQRNLARALEFQRIERINWKGFAVLGGIVVLAIGSYFPVKFLLNRQVRNSAMAQAEKARSMGDVDLALRHLQRYLTDQPEDITALELKAKILSGVELPRSQLLDAAGSLDLLWRLDPSGSNGADRLATRRKLADFYIRYSDELKRDVEFGSDPDLERLQSRYAAAASIASQLVDDSNNGNYKDSVAHRLLARAYEGQISDLRGKRTNLNDPRSLDAKANSTEDEDLRLRTIKNYKRAIELDSHDLEASARLANLYFTWTKDQKSADDVLDAMLQANPTSVDARLTRYRAFSFSGREEQARAELNSILEIAPNNVEVRIEVAQVALGKREFELARKQLDSIPQKSQDNLQVKILRGYLEFAAQNPNDAIDQWRRGLSLVGGSNQELTWKLAFNLLQLGRFVEAEPLKKQYDRLSKGDKNGMGKYLEALFDIGYGRLYEARRKLEKIKDIVQPAIKPDVLLSLGRCCELMGDTDASLLAYRGASAASPRSVAPRLAIARHLQSRQPDEAIAEVDRALLESPDEANLLIEAIRLRMVNLTANTTLQADRSRQIEKLLDRLQTLAPQNPSLVYYQSEYLAASGKIPLAIDALRGALKGEGRKTPELWIALAKELDRANRRPEAIAALDEGSKVENSGDRVKIRVAKSRLLVRSGKGQAAKEVLAANPESLGFEERPMAAKALGELLRELGDRDGALAAYSEWSRLEPKAPTPALAMLAMAQVDNDEKAAKLGQEALRAIGGEKEPYGIAARALDLMRTDPTRPGPPSADRLYEAELLVKTLRQEVPSLKFGALLEGMVQEYRGNLEAAIKSYKMAQKDDLLSPALPKLIEALLKLKRFDELDRLKQEFNHEAEIRQAPGMASEFDRVAAAVALKLGDKDRAEYFASKLADGRRDNVGAQATRAWILDSNNQSGEAEESLKTLVKEKPNDPSSWLTLIAFQALRRTPAEVARTIGQARREYKAERPELFLAQCYWIGKDIPKAKEAYKQALDLRPDDLVTLRSLTEFYTDKSEYELLEPILRKVLKLEPTTNWAARLLALMLSNRLQTGAWTEAWSLVAPGTPALGDTPEDRLTRATILARCPDSNKRKEAVASFTSLVNDLPASSPMAIDTRWRLAQALIDIERFAEAWEAIRPVADDFARPNSGALILAIEALARSNRPDDAEKRLERLAAIDPLSPMVQLSKSWIQIARGKKTEAIASLEATYNLSSKGPNAESVGIAAIERMIKFGDVETSLRVAKDVASRWPANAWCLARVYNLRQEYDLALAQCEIAMEAGSARDALRFAVASAIVRRDDSDFIRRVEVLGEKAQVKSPKDFNVPVSLAMLRHLQGRYEDEIACYRKALELTPSNLQFMNNMAWTLCEGLHHPQEALRCVQDAITRDGETAAYLDTRGVVYERLGQFDLATADLEKSVQGDPTPATYFHLARVCLKMKNPEASRRNRDLAIKNGFDTKALDPTDRDGLQEVMGLR